MSLMDGVRGWEEKHNFSYCMSLTDMPVLPRADDLIPEENDTVLLALKRLPPKEAYDRVFRLRRAFQVSPSMIQRAGISDSKELICNSVRWHINCCQKTNRQSQKRCFHSFWCISIIRETDRKHRITST